MKQLFLIIVFFLLANTFACAQSVTNVRFEQSGKQIVIYYDLYGETGNGWNISVFCSKDKAKTLGMPLQKVTGACGDGVLPGENKKITWDVLTEWEKLEGDISFIVQATKSKDQVKENIEAMPQMVDQTHPKTNYSPEYYKYKKSKTFWLVSGLVTASVGTVGIFQANKYYSDYQNATTDAESLHQKAKTYDTIYPICFALAGVCTIEFIIKSGKQKKAKNQTVGFYPQSLHDGAGLGLVYNF